MAMREIKTEPHVGTRAPVRKRGGRGRRTAPLARFDRFLQVRPFDDATEEEADPVRPAVGSVTLLDFEFDDTAELELRFRPNWIRARI